MLFRSQDYNLFIQSREEIEADFNAAGYTRTDIYENTLEISDKIGDYDYHQNLDLLPVPKTNADKKLKEMALRGEPGEREVAQSKLDEISKKYMINVDKYLSDKKIGRVGYKFSFEDEEYVDGVDKESLALIENKKIIFQRISDKNNFTLSTKSEYLMNTLWMINGNDLEFLLGVLNSRLIRFYMKNRVAPKIGRAHV